MTADSSRAVTAPVRGFEFPRFRSAGVGELVGVIAPDASVVPRFTCSYGDQIRIGAGALVNFDCLLMDHAAIEIGDHALVGPNSWLAAGVLVGPGVTIGADAVVGHGSVVVRDVPPGTLVAGNPARVIRAL